MTAQPHVYYCRVPPDGLFGVVDGFKEKLCFLYFETAATMDIVWYLSPERAAEADERHRRPDPGWLHGRAFGKALEVRWERQGDDCHVHLLSEAVLSLDDGWEEVDFGRDEKGQPVLKADAESSILLWGTHRQYLRPPHSQAAAGDNVPHEWIETRIPRPLRYPVDEATPFVEAVVVNYRIGGGVVLSRLKGLRRHSPREEGEDG